MRAAVAAVVVSAADAATKPDRQKTAHVAKAGAGREGPLRPFSYRGRSGEPESRTTAARAFHADRELLSVG